MTFKNEILVSSFIGIIFGINEDIIKKAVKKTKEEVKLGVNIDDGINLMKVTDWIIFLIVICFILYLFDYGTQGHVYRILYGLFPEEFETLNFKRPT